MTTAVDNSDAMTATTRETRLLVRYSLASITAAVTTIALKSLAAALTGSVGFLSDAMEAGVNLVAAVVAMLALLLAARPPERLRVCGHQADALGEIGGGLGAAGVVEVAAASASVRVSATTRGVPVAQAGRSLRSSPHRRSRWARQLWWVACS